MGANDFNASTWTFGQEHGGRGGKTLVKRFKERVRVGVVTAEKIKSKLGKSGESGITTTSFIWGERLKSRDEMENSNPGSGVRMRSQGSSQGGPRSLS